MEDLFAQAGHRSLRRKAVHHQGMHYLYHEFCRKEGVSGCPVCGGSKEESEQRRVVK